MEKCKHVKQPSFVRDLCYTLEGRKLTVTADFVAAGTAKYVIFAAVGYNQAQIISCSVLQDKQVSGQVAELTLPEGAGTVMVGVGYVCLHNDCNDINEVRERYVVFLTTPEKKRWYSTREGVFGLVLATIAGYSYMRYRRIKR